jgi:dihydroorotate dehydrogenase
MHQLEKIPLAQDLLNRYFCVNDPRLKVSIGTLTCPNPVGMAAGFDTTGELAGILPSFGFGFLELGTFTPLQQEGQRRPRLFRYRKEKALINRMGFSNPGIKAAAEMLKEKINKDHRVPIGINIGKGRNTPLDEAVDDYLTAFEVAFPHADYVAVNVSSPNTPNLRDLQAAKHLKAIMSRLVDKNRALAEAMGEPPKPIFTKVSPDLHEETLEEVAQVGLELGIGIIATNTTIDHSSLKNRRKEEGGLSGRPLREKSNHILKRLYSLTKGAVPLIGVGGIFSAEDAYEKIRLGASLIQIYTGWIYEGPGLLPKINRGLLRLMERDGIKTIKDAVGTL